MKAKLILFATLLILFTVNLANSQGFDVDTNMTDEEIDSIFEAIGTVTVEESIEHIFGNLDLNELSTGILIDKSRRMSNILSLRGEEPSTNHQYKDTCTNYMDWLAILCDLELAINTNTDYAMIKSMQEELGYNYQNYDEVHIGIINSLYDKFKDSIFEKNLVTNNEGHLYDVPGRLESPYITQRVFAASPLIGQVDEPTVRFVLDQNYFFTNTDEILDSIYIDFDDGNGFRKVDGASDIYYMYPGDKILKFKVYYVSNYYYCSAILKVFDSLSYTNKSHKSSDNCHEINGKLFYSVYPRCGMSENSLSYIMRPVIVVRGYDPTAFYTNIDVCEALQDYYDQKDGKGQIFTKLRNRGYDIIVVENYDPVGDMTIYALRLVEFINLINDQLLQNGSKHEIIMYALSAGALATNLALNQMEVQKANNPTAPYHRCRTFVSLDGEYQGSDVLDGNQHLVDWVIQREPLLTIADFSALFLAEGQNHTISGHVIYSDINKEALISHISQNKLAIQSDPTAHQDPLRITWMINNNLGQTYKGISGNIGFPQECRKIGIAYGNSDGSKNLLIEDETYLLNQKLFIGTGGPVKEIIRAKTPSSTSATTVFSGLEYLSIGGVYFPLSAVNYKCAKIENPQFNLAGSYIIPSHPELRMYLMATGRIPLLNNYMATTRGTFCPNISALNVDVTNENIDFNVKEKLMYYPTITGGVANSDPYKFYGYPHLSPNTSLTPFDMIVCPNKNTQHTEGVNEEDLLTTNKTYQEYLTQYVINEIDSTTLFLQNKTVPSGYYAEYENDTILSGHSVTQTIKEGNYTIEANAEIELEASNTIILKPGFYAKKGSHFKAFIETPDVCYQIDPDDPQVVIKGHITQGYNNFHEPAKESDSSTNDLKIDIVSFIYPNPNNGTFIIKFSGKDNKPYIVAILNICGIKLAEIAIKNNEGFCEINENLLQEGIYIVNILDGNRIIKTERMVIVK